MAVAYPLFVFEKDDSSIRLVEDEAKILYHLEEIDIENDEYVFWDANGGGVSVDVSKNRVMRVNPCAAEFSLIDAFTSYASSVGLGPPNPRESPIEAWNKMQAELAKRPKKNGLFSRW